MVQTKQIKSWASWKTGLIVLGAVLLSVIGIAAIATALPGVMATGPLSPDFTQNAVVSSATPEVTSSSSPQEGDPGTGPGPGPEANETGKPNKQSNANNSANSAAEAARKAAADAAAAAAAAEVARIEAETRANHIAMLRDQLYYWNDRIRSIGVQIGQQNDQLNRMAANGTLISSGADRVRATIDSLQTELADAYANRDSTQAELTSAGG